MIVISETKWVDESRSDCLKSLGFDGVVSVPSVGRSGGIAAAWRSDQIDAVLCRRDRQFLHFRCCLNGGDPFFLTPIYSIPDGTHKHLLWSALEDFASKISIPWTTLGDFNDIASALEKTGGNGGSDARIQLFSDRLTRCKLTDLGFCGPRFTWKGIA
ncbi:hypothetical protein K1719_025856 [Acacia pycnantha]|nr:hypothetical protein K1719_025856 [Acacia pycnantha]